MPVIGFQNVSKVYSIGEGGRDLRDSLAVLSQKIVRRNRDNTGRSGVFWALRDVGFELHSGQILGVVGRNGAGKTTSLKLLSGVTRPTSGLVQIDGRVSSLIELGAGFHPDLTGRENVFLNGVILGLSRKEVARKFDQIVEFAGIERFIDTPVKRYSSGMYARLGFAVAAHSEPDILLIDEVLAVGDVAFQRKCYDFLHTFVKQGKIAVFVSHSLHVLEQLCNRLLWLESGRIHMLDSPGRVLPRYLDRIEEEMLASTVRNHDDNPIQICDQFRLRPIRFVNGCGKECDAFQTGEDVIVEIPYETQGIIPSPHFYLGVLPPDGTSPLFAASMLVDGQTPSFIQGAGTIKCRFRSLPLAPTVYTVWGEVWDSERTRRLSDWQKLGAFRILEASSALMERPKGSIRHLRADAPIRVQYEWEY